MNDQYTEEQRIFIAETFEATKSGTLVRRAFRRKFKINKNPTPTTIHRIHSKFMNLGTVVDQRKGRSGRRKTVRVDAKINLIKAYADPSSITEEMLNKSGDSRDTIVEIKKQFDEKQASGDTSSQQMSANKIALVTGISRTTVQTVLKEDLNLTNRTPAKQELDSQKLGKRTGKRTSQKEN
jgi:hypothetical protein